MSAEGIAANPPADLSGYKVVVIGAGVGGLVAGAYLARAGCNVTVVEASNNAGGCASCFSVGPFRFHAGASTLAGLEPDMPLGIILGELGLPSLAGFHKNALTIRHGNRVLTLSPSGRNASLMADHYGSGFGRFWVQSSKLAGEAWRLIVNAHVPPGSIPEALRTLRLGGSRLLPHLLKSTRFVLGREKQVSSAAWPLLDELLLISAQSTARHTPFLFGALGLQYLERPLCRPAGGVGELVRLLEEAFIRLGGRIHFGTWANEIRRRGLDWEIQTSRGPMTARCAVLNLTHWDAEGLTHGAIRSYFRMQSRLYRRAWGSCGLYMAMEDVLPHHITPYQQLILPCPLPVSRARSLFVTFSGPSERPMAPPGYRTVSVSCHTPVRLWQQPEPADHDQAKRAVILEIRQALEGFFPQLKGVQPVVEMGATPKTWEERTRRAKGRVGGIPFDYRNLRYGYPSGITPFPGLVRVGDTIFPGQSVVAVAWGARRVAMRLTKQISKETGHRRSVC